jgi:hypothetical protein
VINLDLPWNPAVLEQRIGRVHRLGQGRPVRVINFTRRGRSRRDAVGLEVQEVLFAGVLDGGERRCSWAAAG